MRCLSTRSIEVPQKGYELLTVLPSQLAEYLKVYAADAPYQVVLHSVDAIWQLPIEQRTGVIRAYVVCAIHIGDILLLPYSNSALSSIYLHTGHTSWRICVAFCLPDAQSQTHTTRKHRSHTKGRGRLRLFATVTDPNGDGGV